MSLSPKYLPYSIEVLLDICQEYAQQIQMFEAEIQTRNVCYDGYTILKSDWSKSID